MTDLLSSFVLFLSVLGLTLAEKKYLDNLFTPFTVAAWPFAIISLLVNLFAVRLEFLPVTARVNYFILLNLFIIWLVGYLMSHSKKRLLKKESYLEVFSRYREFRYFLLILSWIVIAAVYLKIASTIGKEGWQFIGTDKFEKTMIAGPVAHLTIMGKALLILLVLILWNSRKSFLDYITMILLGISIVSLMVKYHIMWVVLIIFFTVNLNLAPKYQFKKVASIALLVIILFIANYFILIFSWGTFSASNPKMWQFIFGWLLNYVTSGTILLDKWMDLAYTSPWWTPFIVFVNLKNVIIGNPERIDFLYKVAPGFMHVSPKFFSNVGTSFGTYFLIGGFPFTILATISTAGVSYWFYLKSFYFKNPIAIFMTAVFLTLGSLSFFGQYFTILSLYEMTFFYLFFVGIFKLIHKIRVS
jgi:hypothetical protein